MTDLVSSRRLLSSRRAGGRVARYGRVPLREARLTRGKGRGRSAAGVRRLGDGSPRLVSSCRWAGGTVWYGGVPGCLVRDDFSSLIVDCCVFGTEPPKR